MGVTEKTATPIFLHVKPLELDLFYFSVRVQVFSLDNKGYIYIPKNKLKNQTNDQVYDTYNTKPFF